MAQQNNFQQIAQQLQLERINQSKRVIKVAQELRVPVATIEQLEDPSKSTVPVANMYGLYVRYAQYLGVDTNKIQTMLDDVSLEDITPQKRNKKSRSGNRKWFFIALPRVRRAVFMLVLVGAIIGYAFVQLLEITSSPDLVITNPDALVSATNNSLFTITGVADSQSTVFIAGEPITTDGSNVFSHEVYLQPGLNIIEVSSVDSFSRSSSQQISITFEQ